MIDIVNLQEVALLKDVIVSPGMPKMGQNLYTIEEVNALLSKGWIILKIGTMTQYDDENTTRNNASIFIYDRYSMLLGFPHHGIDPIADQYREEFFPKDK